MLKFCGYCFMCMSIWGIFQLYVMGILYRIEALGLIEDTEAHHFKNVVDFIEKTTKNYKAVSTNCFVAGSIYILILGLAVFCIYSANKKEEKKAAVLADDTLSCTFQDEPLIVKTKAVKTKPVKTKPVKTKPEKIKPVKTKPVKTEPVKTEPVKTTPVKQITKKEEKKKDT